MANFLVRFRAATVAGAVKTFRDYRPPGIYKEDYIRDAYRRNNERMCACFQLDVILRLISMQLNMIPITLFHCIPAQVTGSMPCCRGSAQNLDQVVGCPWM